TDPLDDLIASATAGADFDFSPNSEPQVDLWNAPRLAEASLVTTTDGRVVLRLAGGDAGAPSNGPTGGYSIRVPDELERAASGRPIRVRVVARATDSAPSTRLAVAYSTNDV